VLSRKELKLGKKLYVGGLPYSTDESSLENLFTGAGTVESVRIITDRDTGRAKGFGFVEMSNDSEASRAISMYNGVEFGGRTINVSEARPQTERPQRSSGGYSNGGGGRGGYGGGDRNGGGGSRRGGGRY
jgi:RNA recognition motif-containing protein